MQTTALLGLATAALPFGLPIIRIWPKAGTGYVIIVLLLYLWAGILALTDMWAIKFFFGRLSDENRLEQLRLEAELRRRRRDPRRNGRDPPPGQPQDRPAPGPKPEGEP
jgi:hypothetical protein